MDYEASCLSIQVSSQVRSEFLEKHLTELFNNEGAFFKDAVDKAGMLLAKYSHIHSEIKEKWL